MISGNKDYYMNLPNDSDDCEDTIFFDKNIIDQKELDLFEKPEMYQPFK